MRRIGHIFGLLLMAVILVASATACGKTLSQVETAAGAIIHIGMATYEDVKDNYACAKQVVSTLTAPPCSAAPSTPPATSQVPAQRTPSASLSPILTVPLTAEKQVALERRMAESQGLRPAGGP